MEKALSHSEEKVSSPVVQPGYIKPQHREIHDPSVKFEEYHYYAKRTREEQRTYETPKTNWREILLRKKNEEEVAEESVRELTEDILSNPNRRLEITDEEWANASRAFRTTSWGACE